MQRHLFLLLICAAPLAAQTYVDSLAFGGIGSDTAYGVAVDGQGNTYACGNFDGTVDIQPGTASFNISGFDAGFVSKYDSARTTQWGALLEPVNAGDWVIPEMPAVDSAGNVYVVGRFFGSVDFDPSAGQVIKSATDQLGNPVSTAAFVVKLDANGDFQWVRTITGDYSWGVRIGVTDSLVCVTGLYGGNCDLDPGTGTVAATTPGVSTFVCALDNNGDLVWADGYASPVLDLATQPVIQANGDVILAVSYIQNITLGQNANAPSFTAGGNVDMLIIRHSVTGTVIWTQVIQGAACNVVPSALAQDQQGCLYLTGTVRGDPDFDPGQGVQTDGVTPGKNSFVAKYDNDGNLIWAKGLFSNQEVTTFGCACDAAGVVLSGQLLGSADLNPGASYATHYLTDGAAFAVRLDVDGDYVWSISFGGTTTGTGASGNQQATTQVYGMASDGLGTLVISGPFEDTADFDPGVGVANTAAVADRDGWVLWLDDADASQTPPLQIQNTTLPRVIEGDPASAQLMAVNGSGTYQWSIDQGYLPPGVTGLPYTGSAAVTLSGTVTASGPYYFRVRVTDGLGATATRNFTWTIISHGGTPPGASDSRAHGSSGGCAANTAGTTLLALLVLLFPWALYRRHRAGA